MIASLLRMNRGVISISIACRVCCNGPAVGLLTTCSVTVTYVRRQCYACLVYPWQE